MPTTTCRTLHPLTSPYRYGLTIVEDDAYYYMQHRAADPNATVPGLSGLGPSFLSMDTDGRVVRLDTFSKLLAPGFRMAWVSASNSFALTLTLTLTPTPTLTLTITLTLALTQLGERLQVLRGKARWPSVLLVAVGLLALDVSSPLALTNY